jgi:hypothetical protein
MSLSLVSMPGHRRRMSWYDPPRPREAPRTGPDEHAWALANIDHQAKSTRRDTGKTRRRVGMARAVSMVSAGGHPARGGSGRPGSGRRERRLVSLDIEIQRLWAPFGFVGAPEGFVPLVSPPELKKRTKRLTLDWPVKHPDSRRPAKANDSRGPYRRRNPNRRPSPEGGLWSGRRMRRAMPMHRRRNARWEDAAPPLGPRAGTDRPSPSRLLRTSRN